MMMANVMPGPSYNAYHALLHFALPTVDRPYPKWAEKDLRDLGRDRRNSRHPSAVGRR